jgi:hypothetical protein
MNYILLMLGLSKARVSAIPRRLLNLIDPTSFFTGDDGGIMWLKNQS